MFFGHGMSGGGDVKSILLLDNCSTHKAIDLVSNYIKPPNLTIIFFPPKLTSRHQPSDMGLIAMFKRWLQE